jgi:hypothetical protein
MTRQHDYLRYAQQCRQMVGEGDTANYCDVLRAMAQEWQRLAAEDERVAELVQAFEQLLPPTALLSRSVRAKTPCRDLIEQLARPFRFGPLRAESNSAARILKTISGPDAPLVPEHTNPTVVAR